LNATKWMRLGALVIVAAAALPTAASNPTTVGELIVGIAQIRDLDATDARIAAESLTRAGVTLPTDLQFSKALTEADVIHVARAFGLKVTTTRPDQLFDEGQLNRFFTAFRGELSTDYVRSGPLPGDNGLGPAFDPFSKGKGKGKSVASPTDP